MNSKEANSIRSNAVVTLRRIEDKLVRDGISDREQYETLVKRSIATACFGLDEDSSRVRLIMKWGQYLLKTDVDLLRADLAEGRYHGPQKNSR